jgi:hypothetical protein
MGTSRNIKIRQETAMSAATRKMNGTVARIEWERLHHNISAILLLADGRIVHVHSQGLGESGQDHLILTREGDAIEVTMADEPEPHACRYVNQSIAAMARPAA